MLIMEEKKEHKKIREHYVNGMCLSYLIAYAVVFIIGVTACFYLFYKYKVTMIWSKDGWGQHYRALIFYSRYLKGFVENILYKHTFTLPTYNLHIGLGSDIIQTLHYYAIGDPLTLFSVFVKDYYMSYFYSAMMLVRVFLAGLAFSCYAIYMMTRFNKQDHKVPYIAVLCAVVMYCFNGFVFYAGTRHPYFVNPMIYYPLVLLGIEKIYDHKSLALLVVAVALSALSSFYFFYMIVILTILYVLLTIFIHHKINTKDFWKTFVKILGGSILGVGISAVILLPQLMALLGSSRLSNHIETAWIGIPTTLISQLAALFSVEAYGSNWTFIGTALIGFVAVVVMFTQKKNWPMKIAFILLTCLIFSPKGAQLMNGMSYPANRWVWGYIMFLAMVFLYSWEKLFSLSKKQKIFVLIFVALLTLVCLWFSGTREKGVFLAIIVGVLMILAIISGLSYRIVGIVSLCLLLVGASGEAYLLFNPNGKAKYLKEMVTFKNAKEKIYADETKALESVRKGDTSYARYEGDQSTIARNGNHSLLSDQYSMQYYWSLENGNITQFRYDNGIEDNDYVYRYGTLQSRTILSTLAGVKYYIGANKLYNYKSLGTYDGYTINENESALPFGYTYETAMDEKDYEALSSDTKQDALLDNIVLKSSDLKTSPVQTYYKNDSLSYKVKSTNGVTLIKNGFKASKNNATVTLEINSPSSENETYLMLSGLSFTRMTARSKYSTSAWNKLSEKEKLKVKIKDANYFSADLLSSLSATYQQGTDNRYVWTPIYVRQSMFYRPIGDRVLSFGVTKGGKETITLSLAKKGTYHYSSLSIKKQSMKGYKKAVKKLKEDTLKNVNFHESKRTHSTNLITGKITVSKNKYLLMTLPYSKGWSAYVDGKKVDLMQANTIYSGLYLTKGTHTIKLIYSTPGFKIGAVITLLSLLGGVLAIIFVNRKKHHQVEKE
jgi:uncharacterized membrane protein YfhO